MIKYLKSRTMAFTLISFLISLVLAGIIIAAAGYSPVEAYSAMLGGAFGSTYNLAQTAGTAIPLIFAGLAMAVASKAGIFNIGIEGQILAGALPAALAGTYITGLHAVLHIPVCILVAAIFGGIWAMLAAVIKNKLQISEVIITIMLNYVALYLVEYLVNNPFKSEGMVVRTEEIQDSARLVSLVAHTRLNTGIFIALLAVFLFWVLFYKTKLGYEMRATGDSPFAAESAGINNKKNLLAAMFISGALAGIGGACEVMGVQGYYISGMTTGYGFSGIAIAVMGHNQPLGTLASALLFGALNAGASSMNRMTDIPGEFISVLQALIILFISTPGIVIAIQNLYKRRKAVTS